jgi:predicted O-methyltransferase YrrM
MRIESQEQKYLNEVFGLDDAELNDVRAELHRHNVEFMSVSGAEARILQFLTRALGVMKIVEVGTLFGYSTLAFAKALPANGHIWTLEKNRENFAIAQKHFAKFEAGKKITALNGDAAEILSSIEKEGPFDMVFIDADKAGYLKYLDWAEINVRPGGYIVGDNTFLFGALWGQTRDRNINEKQIAAMKEFNRRLADTSRYNSTLIPTVEGLTVAQKLR